MSKNLVSSLVAGLALSAATVAPAQAGVMSSLTGYVGPLYFDIVGVDQGSLYSANCASAGACDGAPLFSQAAHHMTGSSEDAWGLFRVKGIYNDSLQSTTIWQQTSGDYLLGTYGGLIDQSAVVSGGNQQTFSSGGGMKMWNTVLLAGYNAAIADAGATLRDLTTGAVTGVDGVGTLILSADFAGAAFNGIVGSYQNTFTAGNRQLIGNGYLNVTGGAAAGIIGRFVNDGNGVPVDVSLATTNNPNNGLPAGWATPFVGTAVTAVPEPETYAMMLAGLGLLGFMARRKSQQAV
ncbi:MAG: FxDxF family PEP-CTERM protein [Sulfuritalea sp.]|nr:FxDxF family PEP-CTERM protein [Sulfuritalea sp.]